MERSTCLFSGRVQGVGFRYTAMNIAQSYDVAGYVRNLPDGRVEVVIEGVKDQRQRMIEELQQHMGMFISDAHVIESPGTGEFRRFTIVH